MYLYLSVVIIVLLKVLHILYWYWNTL